MKIGDYIILEKIEDKKFEGFHPNGINVGNNLIRGYYKEPVEIGKQLFLYSKEIIFEGTTFPSSPTCRTSKVEKLDIENMLLETMNSIYKITIKE